MGNVNNKYMQNMACIIWLMSIIKYAEYGLYFLANVSNKYAEYGLCYLVNVNNKYAAEYGLYYLANVNNNICRIQFVLYD